MMNPVNEDLERYLWGETLPVERALACEDLVAVNPDLQKNFHQTSRLKSRFQMFRECLRDSNEASRHLWFVNSKSEGPVPKYIRQELFNVIDRLRIKRETSNTLYAEIMRRLGVGLVDKERDELEELRISLSRSMSMESFEVESASSPYDTFIDDMKSRKFPRRNSILFVEETYPEVVNFVREYFTGEYKAWIDGKSSRSSLSILEANESEARLMAALRLIDLVSK